MYSKDAYHHSSTSAWHGVFILVPLQIWSVLHKYHPPRLPPNNSTSTSPLVKLQAHSKFSISILPPVSQMDLQKLCIFIKVQKTPLHIHQILEDVHAILKRTLRCPSNSPEATILLFRSEGRLLILTHKCCPNNLSFLIK